MLEQFKTILKEGQAEIIEKKSRFIATVRPVFCEEEAKCFIEEMRKKYYNASHNVFAYQIGEKNELQRFSDDGEPQSTAGMPVLNVLVGEDIKNTAIVVTRYFGGTLLGTGGLVRAYGKAAKEGLLAAGITQVKLYTVFHVETNYNDSGKVQYEILQQGHFLQDTIYTEQVEYIVLVEAGLEKEFQKSMVNVTAARAKVMEQKKVFATFQEGTLQICDSFLSF